MNCCRNCQWSCLGGAILFLSNSKKSVPRSHRNIFIQSDLECSPCYFPIHANEELTRCDRLIKEECLKNISVYEVIDKIDNELTNIYYENS